MKRMNVHKKERVFIKKNRALIEVLDFLVQRPFTSFSLSELAKLTKVSKSRASKIVKELEKSEFIKTSHISNLLRIQFNRENMRGVGYKIAHNIYKIYESGIIEYILNKWGTPKAIILFGSVRKGEDEPGSDIDIAVEINEEKPLEILSIEKEAKTLKEYEKEWEREFKILFFNRKKVDKNVFLNIANGIVIHGFLEVKL